MGERCRKDGIAGHLSDIGAGSACCRGMTGKQTRETDGDDMTMSSNGALTTYKTAKQNERAYRTAAGEHARAGREERADACDRRANWWADRAFDALLIEADAQARRDWL